MKKLIYLILFISFFCESKAQDNTCYSDTIFRISKQEMVLDLPKYKEAILKKDSIVLANNSFENKIHVLSDGTIGFIKTNKTLNVSKWIDYTIDGKIQSMNVYYNSMDGSSVEIGNGYTFNSDGTIKEKINFDKGYKICWNEVVPLVKKIIGESKLKKYEITEFGVTRINLNESPDSTSKWKVNVSGNNLFIKKNKGADGVTYIIDGITGKFLSKRTYKIVD